MFKDACESCGLRKETADMFVELGHELVRSQIKEALGINVELLVKKCTEKEMKGLNHKFDAERRAKEKPDDIDEVFSDGWISTTQMRELYKQYVLKKEPFQVAVGHTIEDPVGICPTGNVIFSL